MAALGKMLGWLGLADSATPHASVQAKNGIEDSMKFKKRMVLRFAGTEVLPAAAEYGRVSVISVDHSKADQSRNLVELARSDIRAKEWVTGLANRGYYMARSQNGRTTFITASIARRIAARKANHIHFNGDVFYTITKAELSSGRPRLLVVFSSVADVPYSGSLMRRNFFTNFDSIRKYVPANAHVLRISDLGSIVGSFYLNNNHSTAVEQTVQDVIESVTVELRAAREDVVLYGASKGGTAALYHGVLGGYQFVAVDPIVNDELYEQKHRDAHFTIGTFPESKQARFAKLLGSTKSANGTVISSPNSPQYPYIHSLLGEHESASGIALFESHHPAITDHPDVGPNTINVLTALINGYFYGFLAQQRISQSDLEGSAVPKTVVHPHTGLQGSLDAALVEYKRKNWPEAIRLYSEILAAYSENAPMVAFHKLAVAQRAVKDFSASEQTLKRGFSKFKDNVTLLIEYAALFNNMKRWEDAVQCWEKAKKMSSKFSELNYDRYALACEAVGDRTTQRTLLMEKLIFVPAALEALVTRITTRAMPAEAEQTAILGVDAAVVRAIRTLGWPVLTLQPSEETAGFTPGGDDIHFTVLLASVGVKLGLLPQAQQLVSHIPARVRDSLDYGMRTILVEVQELTQAASAH